MLARNVGPHESGFFCDDKSIRMPYAPSTFGLDALIFYCVTLNLVLVSSILTLCTNQTFKNLRFFVLKPTAPSNDPTRCTASTSNIDQLLPRLESVVLFFSVNFALKQGPRVKLSKSCMLGSLVLKSNLTN